MICSDQLLRRIQAIPSRYTYLVIKIRQYSIKSAAYKSDRIPLLEGQLLKRSFDHDQKVFNNKVRMAFTSNPGRRLFPRIQDCILKIDNDYYDQYKGLEMSSKDIFNSTLEIHTVLLIMGLHFTSMSGEHYSESMAKAVQISKKISKIGRVTISSKFTRNLDTSNLIGGIDIDSQVFKLLSIYEYGNADIQLDMNSFDEDNVECLRSLLTLFYEMAYVLHDLKPSFEELCCWILSLTASNVRHACESLSNKSNIPRFVLMDILYRTCHSKLEFNLAYDIFMEYYDFLKVYRADILHVLPNLIFNCIYYDSSKLPSLVSKHVSNIPNTSSIHSMKAKPYLNKLLWLISYNYHTLEKTQSMSQPYILQHISKAQEAIISNFSRFASSASSFLDLYGGFGLSSIIYKMSAVKGEKLFRSMEKKYNQLEKIPSNSKYSLIYIVTKIQICQEKSELLEILQTFLNNENKKLIKRKEVWDITIRKMNDFGILDEERAIGLIEIMVKRKVNFTKTMISELLKPINTISKLESIKLGNRESESFTQKYIKVLYQESIYEYKTNKRFRSYKSFSSKLDYARFLYSKLENKSSKMIGLMLIGETFFQPHNIYKLYESELSANKIIIPDEVSLFALLKAAMKTGNFENSIEGMLVWGDKYATQIAINEFKNNCSKNLNNGESSNLVYPTDNLWRTYIKLLSKYDYQEELYEIISWWENLMFVPDEETLLMLLSVLPLELSASYIRHGQKYLTNLNVNVVNPDNYSSALWPWPTMAQLESCKFYLGNHNYRKWK